MNNRELINLLMSVHNHEIVVLTSTEIPGMITDKIKVRQAKGIRKPGEIVTVLEVG